MERLIRRIIREESEKSIFSPMEIRLFKFVNKFKKELGTEAKMREFFGNTLTTFNIPKNEAGKYHQIYTLNYRPEGDYENVTKENFKDPKRYSTQKRTTNRNASDFTKDKIPFKGSNLEGKWISTRDNQWAYVVTSYGWYPIYVFKYGKWFEVGGRYSSSTGKQMRYSYPISYNSEIGERTIIVNEKQIQDVINGYLTPEELLGERVSEFTKELKSQQRTGKVTTFRGGHYNERVRVKYKILSVRKNRDVYNIVVDVLDVDKFDGNKLDREAGDFFSGEMMGISPNRNKEIISQYFDYENRQKLQGLKPDVYELKVLFRGQ
jgi:hypothetical protein